MAAITLPIDHDLQLCSCVVLTPRFLKSSEDLPVPDCHRLGHGFKTSLLPSSYRIFPRRRACRAHAPLFKWANVGSVVFSPANGRPYPEYRLRALLPPLPWFVCFSLGGLGVGEKPARGELVRSTHRVPSPFIFSYDFSLKPFL